MERMNGKEVARAFGDYVNNFSLKKEDFVNGVMSEHKTLQQSIFGVMLECIFAWSEQYENGRYDLRNEDTCRLSNEIVNTIGKDNMYVRFI